MTKNISQVQLKCLEKLSEKMCFILREDLYENASTWVIKNGEPYYMIRGTTFRSLERKLLIKQIYSTFSLNNSWNYKSYYLITQKGKECFSSD